MKAKVVYSQRPEVFKPVELNITIENKDELEFFFAVANVNQHRLSEFLKELTCRTFDSDNVGTSPLFNVLNTLV